MDYITKNKQKKDWGHNFWKPLTKADSLPLLPPVGSNGLIEIFNLNEYRCHEKEDLPVSYNPSPAHLKGDRLGMFNICTITLSMKRDPASSVVTHLSARSLNTALIAIGVWKVQSAQ